MSALAGLKTKGSGMGERFRRHLIAIAVTIAIVSLGLYFGWIREAPPLIAPGILP
jgi:hypothetical protein